MAGGSGLRKIGDLQVSEVGLGCNNFGRRLDLEGTRAVVDAALEAGVNLLDTADTYGSNGGDSETLLGQVLEGRRDQVVIATKFGMDMRGAGDLPDAPRGSAPYIRAAVDGSLRRLRVDTIDLYQYHQPDGRTPIEETLGALNELVVAGTVRFIGCSNFSAEQLAEAEQVAVDNGYTSFVSLQNEYSLLKRGIEADVLPECERRGVAVLPFFPLASGLLTGKYRRGEDAPEGTRLHGRGSVADDQTFDRLERLAQFCDQRGIEPIDVAIGWLLGQPMIASVIAGATRPDQVRRNVEAGRWTPSAEDRAEIDAIFPRATDLT
jgi:aryl-alcohol dehydrogenase-like predicted oxidoreductase